MASPGNQHCASCIGTLSFSIGATAAQMHKITTAQKNSASRQYRASIASRGKNCSSVYFI